jgi:outer membrane immunogenic protein
MNRYILAGCAGLLAAVLASPIFAAELKPILKAPAYKAPVYVAPFSWSGFYVGGFGGYGVGSSSWVNSATGVGTNNFRVRGFVAGGTAGYNLQTGEWVWGVEADAGGSWINGTTNAGCAPGCETKNIWRATARGRIGHAWERWLPYLTGGAAFGRIIMDPTGGPSDAKTKTGWTVGGGVEYAFMGPWSAKIEYLYADLGNATCGTASCGAPTDVTFKTSIVRGGINYRF